MINNCFANKKYSLNMEKNIDKTVLSEDHLRKIKHRFGYKINESPTYRQLVKSDEQFDEIPMTEAGEEGMPEDKPQTPPTNDVGLDAPVPEFDKTGGDPTGMPMDNAPMDTSPIQPENQVDDLQNEIIKSNIQAMRSIHDQLEGLNSLVQGLNSKVDILNADVEEVREPTNSEKLMNKAKISGPYQYNLSDLWDGNWFNQKREEEKNGGIKELPDGTFVANFDDLPQRSKTDVQNSFNNMV